MAMCKKHFLWFNEPTFIWNENKRIALD